MSRLIDLWEDADNIPITFEHSNLTSVSHAIVAYNQIQNAIINLTVDTAERLSKAPYKSMQILLGLTGVLNDVALQTSRIVDRLAMLC
jgi:hypothetical protein